MLNEIGRNKLVNAGCRNWFDFWKINITKEVKAMRPIFRIDRNINEEREGNWMKMKKKNIIKLMECNRIDFWKIDIARKVEASRPISRITDGKKKKRSLSRLVS